MPNANNLIPNSQRTKEQLSAMGKKGAPIAKAKKAQNKTIRECMKRIIDSPAKDEKAAEIAALFGIEDEELTNRMVIAAALLIKSKDATDSQQVQALKELRAILGEDKDDADKNTQLNISIKTISPDCDPRRG